MSFATLIPLDGLQFRSLPRNAPFIGARHLVRSIHGKKTSAEMKKKRRGWGEKKIGVRQSMGGRVKRPLTIPFPHAINRTIAANAVNRSNRMFQLGDPALKFLRVSSKPISLSTCPRFSIILLHFSESFHFHNRSMTSSIPKNRLWSCEIFGTKSMLYFLYTSSLW